MKTLAFLLMIFTCSSIISQDNNLSHSFSYELTEDVKTNQLKKYLNARDYLNQDSLSSGNNIYFSPYLVDLDFFWFKDAVIEDTVLSNKLFLKNKWFEDYYSLRLDNTLGKPERTDYIAFFSLVENDMLRVEVFLKRKNVNSLRFDDISLFSSGGTQAYLFDFETNSDKVRTVFQIEMIYN